MSEISSLQHDPEAAADLEDFKDRLYSQLKHAGVLGSLRVRGSSFEDQQSTIRTRADLHHLPQGQLRAQLLLHLQNLNGGDAVKSPAADQCRGLWPAAATSLIQNHLQTMQCPFTLSVMQSELDLQAAAAAYSAEDVTQLLGLKRHPQLQQTFQQQQTASGG
jgi:hypothetical protein